MFEIYLIGFGLTLAIFAYAAGKAETDLGDMGKTILVICCAAVWPATWLTLITYSLIAAGKKGGE